ncbi:MAG TPA: hypothetical protein VNA31_08225 [bacterium]|nr:hypothetical protein [bacterium]
MGPNRNVQLGATCLAVSAVLLTLFPLVRPFADRSPHPEEVAAAFASPSWVLAHVLGGLGFVLLPIGLFGVYTFLRGSAGEGRAFQGLILSWIGVGLILPTVLGTEAFGLRAIGQAAVQQKNPDLLAIANAIRFGPQRMLFFPGLLLLAAGAVAFAVAGWKSQALPRWSGVLFAVGLALFFPLLPQAIRIADGFLIGVGGSWVALTMLSRKGTGEI